MAEYFVEALKQLNVSQEIIDKFVFNGKCGKPEALLIVNSDNNYCFEQSAKEDKIVVFERLNDLVFVGAEMKGHERLLHEKPKNIQEYLLDSLYDGEGFFDMLKFKLSCILREEINYIRKYTEKLNEILNSVDDNDISSELKRITNINDIKNLISEFKDENTKLWSFLIVRFRKVRNIEEAKQILDIIKYSKKSDNYDWIANDKLEPLTLYQYVEGLSYLILKGIPEYQKLYHKIHEHPEFEEVATQLINDYHMKEIKAFRFETNFKEWQNENIAKLWHQLLD